MRSKRPKRNLVKVVDELTLVQCASGPGLIREEVWEDLSGEIARYNLAFINHFLTSKDNGRVLGYDNAHGRHERHFMGLVEVTRFESYDAQLERFITEVRQLRRRTR